MAKVPLYILIGRPGVGKSPFVRKFIDGRRCLIFDIQNEYGERTKYDNQIPVGLSSDNSKPRSRFVGTDVDKFIDCANTKTKTVIVFEEATAFFVGKTEKALRRYIINRFHTGNISLFIFHSIQSVPPFIFDLCNYIVLFKTNDLFDNVRRKRPELVDAFQKLKQLPDGEKIIVELM
jgi:hypothetical protein